MAAEYARKRRFGGNETAAGTRKAFFSISFVGSEIIVSDDSETDRDMDVSYQFFYWLRKSRQIGSDLWQGRARLRLNQRDVRAVDQSIDRNVFPEIIRADGLTRLPLGLRNVAGIYGTICGRVAEKHTHGGGKTACKTPSGVSDAG
jgi:hypothetical protein